MKRQKDESGDFQRPFGRRKFSSPERHISRWKEHLLTDRNMKQNFLEVSTQNLLAAKVKKEKLQEVRASELGGKRGYNTGEEPCKQSSSYGECNEKLGHDYNSFLRRLVVHCKTLGHLFLNRKKRFWEVYERERGKQAPLAFIVLISPRSLKLGPKW